MHYNMSIQKSRHIGHAKSEQIDPPYTRHPESIVKNPRRPCRRLWWKIWVGHGLRVVRQRGPRGPFSWRKMAYALPPPSAAAPKLGTEVGRGVSGGVVADVTGGAIAVIERRDASKEVEDNGESVGRIFSKAGIGGPSKEVRRSMLYRSGDVEASGGVGVEVSGGAGVEVLVVE